MLVAATGSKGDGIFSVDLVRKGCYILITDSLCYTVH